MGSIHMEFSPPPPPQGHKRFQANISKQFFFLKGYGLIRHSLDALLHIFLIALLGVCPLPVSCAYLNESMDPHWRPKLLGLLQNWRRVIMQPHPRVLDQISHHQEVTCLMGSPLLGLHVHKIKVAIHPQKQEAVSSKSLNSKLSLPLYFLSCLHFPHTRPGPGPDGVTGILQYKARVNKGKLSQENL